MSSAVKEKSYTASSFQVLKDLEPVRKRPAMYIGDTDKKGLHHLVWEIVDNSVDEYLNGHADDIHVTLHKGGDSITIRDNGRGIPVAMHPKYKKPGLELLLTTLHSGGIPEFLTRLVADAQKPTVHENTFTLVKDDKEKMEVALQWTESTEESFRSYVNGIRTIAGGTHENGFKGGIVKAVRNFMET